MAELALPVIATLALWWASTGAILFVDGLERRTFARSFAAATALLLAALWGIEASSRAATPASALCAFACGLAIWGWQLASFYLGYVTGPRKTACEAGLSGWRRFVEAARTSLYHEIAGALGAGVVAALLWGQPNMTALWTYLILWSLHLSAKLNIFLGVPNLGEELLPAHLAHLASFMARKPMNLLFPASISLATIAATLLAQRAFAAATPFDAAAGATLSTLAALGIAEHWFLVAPIRGNALWQWGLAPAQRPAPRAAADPSQAGDEDSDYARPDGAANAPMESWSAHPPALCDAGGLRQVLDGIGGGRFGDVACVKGVVRTDASWIRFEVEGALQHRALRAAAAPGAVGRRLWQGRGQGPIAGGLRRLRGMRPERIE